MTARTPRGTMTWQERLATKYVVADSGCWVWQGPLYQGYGAFYGTWGIERSANSRAHRWSWIAANGPIPAGMHLDHLCRNRACVNPDHLEPVTAAENKRRAWASKKAEEVAA